MKFRKSIVTAAAVALVAVISACAPKPEPAPPPPKPQFVSRPYPPMGASPNLTIPPKSVDGARLTINSNLSPEQAAWNLRSAFNVAALNCMSTQHAAILEDYRSFLTKHQKSLRDVNVTLDKVFKAQYGKTYIAEREGYQTQVYNYFALPPTIPAFCDAALALGEEFKLVPTDDMVKSSPAALAKLEAVFTGFFDSYEKYQTDFVAWQKDYLAKYGALPSAGFYLAGEPRWQPQPVVPATDPALQMPDYKPENAPTKTPTPQVWQEVPAATGTKTGQ